jgi:hypothetical protein
VLGAFLDELDLLSLAADALTAGRNDKKADFIYIDSDGERAIIGQSYLASQWGKREASTNKAGDLATAARWLLATDIEKLPSALRTHAHQLQKGISEGLIKKLYLLYTHNCHESKNVRAELENAAKATTAICKATVHAHELGIESIQRLFDSMNKDILVNDSIAFDLGGGHYLSKGPNWRALATQVSGAQLHDLAVKYKEDLFSANIRDYLGILKKKRGNINADIKATVESQPEDFWVYNNGVTILTNSFSMEASIINVRGLSIINGAQTTGVLGEATRASAQRALVPCRFVECSDGATIEKIISCNNTQNAIRSFDLRSNDKIQRMLARSFDERGIPYIHRRNKLRRTPPNSIHVDSAAQALASFHGEFQTAIRQKSSIFDDDKLYELVFPRFVQASHVYLIQCLLDAIDSLKIEWRQKERENALTEKQTDYLRLLELTTTKQFVVFVLGRIADQIMGTKVQDLHKWRVRTEAFAPERSKLRDAWKSVLIAAIPKIARSVQEESATAIRSVNRAKATAENLADFFESVGDELRSKLKAIRTLTCCD